MCIYYIRYLNEEYTSSFIFCLPMLTETDQAIVFAVCVSSSVSMAVIFRHFICFTKYKTAVTPIEFQIYVSVSSSEISFHTATSRAHGKLRLKITYNMYIEIGLYGIQ